MKTADTLPLIDPAVWWTGAMVFALLATVALLSRFLHDTNRIGDTLYGELIARIRTWAVIVPTVLIPVALGSFGVRVASVVLGLLCYREFARASGLARNGWLAWTGMAAVAVFASGCIPGDYRAAAMGGGLAAVVVVARLACEPGKFLVQMSLSATAVAWFGICLGTLGDFASRDGGVRIVLWLILCVELNDVAAFVGGKLIKGRKLCPRISPGKTVSGAVTALLMTTIFAGISMGWYWESSTAWFPFVLGFFISAAGQLGDLAMSAMKRRFGVKDFGNLLAGHGGMLDRCDSLLFASPVALLLVSALAMASP